MSNFDTDYTNEIVCPHCGYKQSDSWEWDDSEDEAQCGHCENFFGYERVVSVTYTSSATDEQKAAAQARAAEWEEC